MVIVKAVDMADNRLTPRTHKYCVKTLRRRKNKCRGMCSGKGVNWRMRYGMWIGGDWERLWKSRAIRGRRGMKKGRPRKCY